MDIRNLKKLFRAAAVQSTLTTVVALDIVYPHILPKALPQ